MTAPAEPVNPRYANVTEADVRAAQAAIDAWAAEEVGDFAAALLTLRGILTQQFAEVRWAGYLEGVLVGRRQVAADVRAALAGEGL